jgi:hypothetical protein
MEKEALVNELPEGLPGKWIGFINHPLTGHMPYSMPLAARQD